MPQTLYRLVGLSFAMALVAARADGAPTKPLTAYIAYRETDNHGLPCEDGHDVKAYLMPNGRLRVNNEQFARNGLGARLDAIFRTRAERLLFLVPAPGVPFQVLVDTIATAQKHVDYVALITPSVEQSGGCIVVRILSAKTTAASNFREHRGFTRP
jgi:hypothetical protein